MAIAVAVFHVLIGCQIAMLQSYKHRNKRFNPQGNSPPKITL